ncbi:hypothetical protein ACIQV3_09925 [Streptomyces sp. NPDC099050]
MGLSAPCLLPERPDAYGEYYDANANDAAYDYDYDDDYEEQNW